MAVYKVPQDVEADDKLIGPFSFRQFIYLVIVVISGGLAWGLAQLFIGLILIPLPVMIFFGALALPLRKDQPMEVYMAALVSFHLKPRKRLWDPDGVQSLVEIVAPKTIEVQRVKDLSEDEAERRLSYLAQIADTRGWAVRGVAAPTQNTPMNDDLYFEAQQTQDVFDPTSSVTSSFENRLEQSETQRKQQVIQQMHTPQPAPTPAPQAVQAPVGIPDRVITEHPTVGHAKALFNPYPNSIHQTVIQPLSEQAAAPAPQPAPSPVNTSEKPVSPGIINLVNSTGLSVETIQHEAQRIKRKEAEPSDDEVVISLR